MPERTFLKLVRRLLARAAALWRSPVGKILAVALALRLAGLGWGMPASDGWDDDAVAPRDFLIGLLETYWPGHFYTYPPLHLALLAVASFPVWAAALIRSPSFAPAVVIHSFIAVPVMTGLTVIARSVTILLSLGLLWNLGKIAEDVRGTARAGVWVALAVTTNVVFTYYSQTANLDVPYLFWGVLSIRFLVWTIVHREPRALRLAFAFAAFAVATKDQAYALFLVSFPLALSAWLIADREARARIGTIAAEIARGTAIGLALLLVIDGALTNPSGFSGRVHFLLGSASQDHAFYANDWLGRAQVLHDIAFTFGQHYAWVMAPFVILGIALAWHSIDEIPRRVAALIPLMVALSFTLAFNLTARRTEHRFVMPQSIVWGVYAGLGFDTVQSLLGRGRILAMWVVASLCFGLAFFTSASVEAAMLFDPRYEAERWLRDHVVSGDRIESYDNNVHSIRFPKGAVAERVDVTPLATRNPLPDVTEVRDAFSNVATRNPRFIVVSQFWLDKYLVDPAVIGRLGRVLSGVQARALSDTASHEYFQSLCKDELAYRRVHLATWSSRVWPRLEIHGTLTGDVWIFERLADR